MEQTPSFFNWSLKRLLASEPDSFAKAKLRILFTILLFSMIKIMVAAPAIFMHNQGFQRGRILLIFIVYSLLLKLMLWKRELQRPITHVMLGIGLLIIVTNIFITAQRITIVDVQFTFMLVLSSFYLFDKRYGLAYSAAGILPIAIFLVGGSRVLPTSVTPDLIGSPVFEIIVILNFATIVLAHYLYHQAFSRNIREKEQLNLRLQAAVQEANRAAQSKSDFLSTMSHELRTPLNSVIGMTELLLDSPQSEEQAENLGILSFSAVSLHSLINDILDFNKMDSGKVRLECIDVELHTLVKNICSGFRQQAKEKGLSLLLEIDESIKGLHVNTDPTRITQLIYNLVSNAIKFTPSGSVTVRLRETGRSGDTASIRFAVVDTGIGIEPVKQELIFEPFVQASTSTTREFGGTGLGLAIVRHLLSLFDSEIVLESTAGKGSSFSFELKLAIAARNEELMARGQVTTYDLAGLRILVAEDNVVNRVLMKKVFARWNNEPEFAADGGETLDKVLAADFDVILMDIHMPVMDGYQAAKAIRALADPSKSGTPIIALTASVSDNLREKVHAAGMNDYICKPFNSKELYGKLKALSVSGMP